MDKSTARIDQVEGVKRAFDMGFRDIAVSVAGFQAKAITDIRRFEKATSLDVLVYSVCNTCICDQDVKHIAQADIACASASKVLRTRIASKALVQLGVTIPVYALTEKGKRLILHYAEKFSHKLVIFQTDKLPYETKREGPILSRSIEARRGSISYRLGLPQRLQRI